MDPYLEYPSLWPDCHDGLIGACREAIAPPVAPRYSVAIEPRTYTLQSDDLVFIGLPDLAGVPAPAA